MNGCSRSVRSSMRTISPLLTCGARAAWPQLIEAELEDILEVAGTMKRDPRPVARSTVPRNREPRTASQKSQGGSKPAAPSSSAHAELPRVTSHSADTARASRRGLTPRTMSGYVNHVGKRLGAIIVDRAAINAMIEKPLLSSLPRRAGESHPVCATRRRIGNPSPNRNP
jgi:hypothetical protein